MLTNVINMHLKPSITPPAYRSNQHEYISDQITGLSIMNSNHIGAARTWCLLKYKCQCGIKIYKLTVIVSSFTQITILIMLCYFYSKQSNKEYIQMIQLNCFTKFIHHLKLYINFHVNKKTYVCFFKPILINVKNLLNGCML